MPTSYPIDEQLDSCSYITLISPVPYDLYFTACQIEDDMQTSAVTSKYTCYGSGGGGGTETQLQNPTESLAVLDKEGGYEQFGQTVDINSLRIK